MVIHANGDVVTCCVDWQYETKYGNVAVNSLHELWAGPVLRAMQLKHLDRSAYRDTVCKNCKREPMDSIDEVTDMIRKRIVGVDYDTKN